MCVFALKPVTRRPQVDLPASMVVHPELTAISAVSVEEDAGSSCNGVIMKVPAAQIKAFDAREAGYDPLVFYIATYTLYQSSNAPISPFFLFFFALPSAGGTHLLSP